VRTRVSWRRHALAGVVVAHGGPRLGRAAPRPMRTAYAVMTASAVRALMRNPCVLAVYANGSLATGDLRPRRQRR